MSIILVSVIIMLVIVIAVLIVGLYQKNTNAVCLNYKRLDDISAIVTGGTSGMGLEIARELVQRGGRVIIAGPFANEGSAALQDLRSTCPDNPHICFELLDLGSFQSIRSFAERIIANERRLDILINNAGIGGPHKVTEDGLNYVMQVNYYGTFQLTLLLLPLLRKSARPGEPTRIINVVSASYILGREYIEDTFLCAIPTFTYFNSKLYLVIFTRELARRLKDHEVVVNSVDPGAVGTKIFQTFSKMIMFSSFLSILFRTLFKTPWEGIQTALYASLDREAGKVTGRHLKNCRLVKTSSIACDEEQALRLWNKSSQLVKLPDVELEQYIAPNIVCVTRYDA